MRLSLLLAAGTALSAGGCANAHNTYSTDAGPAVAQGPAVQMESDGLPVQAAPSVRIRQLPDDPAEPFSPNYGGSNPASTRATQPTVKAANDVGTGKSSIPEDLPPAFRRQLIVAVQSAG